MKQIEITKLNQDYFDKTIKKMKDIDSEINKTNNFTNPLYSFVFTTIAIKIYSILYTQNKLHFASSHSLPACLFFQTEQGETP